MKKLLSLMLAALMLAVPVLGASAEEASLLDRMWALSDWSFLTEWGVLTAEEAAMLSADRTAVENGRELVRTAKVTLGQVTDETGEVDTRLIEDVSRTTFISRSRRDEENLSILLDGEELLSLGLGAKDGLYFLGSSLLPGPVSLSAEDLGKLPTRLATALQTNGLISREEAMRFGMMMAYYTRPAWLSLLYAADPETWDDLSLDLTAWDAALSDVQSRMVTADVTEQPADCDAAAQVWTLTVTPEDVEAILRAAIQTMKDNAAVFGEPTTLDLLLMELDGEEPFLPMELHLTGYVDAAGEMVRLEIDMYDTSGNEQPEGFAELVGEVSAPALMLRTVYNRRTTAADTTHELLMGEEQPVAYVAYVNTAPHAMYAQDHRLTFGTIAEDGTRTIDTAAFFCCVVNDTVPGLKSVSLDASVTWPTFTYMSDDTVYAELDFTLSADVKHGGVTEHFPTDGASIRFHANRSVGKDVLDDVYYAVSYDLDGVDLTGTESFTVRYEGETMLEYEAALHTQEPSVSLFDEPATRLSALTDEELAAWVAQVQAQVEAWAAEIDTLFPAGE